MKTVRIALIVLVLIGTVLRSEASSLSELKKDSLPAIQGYPIVDTDQKVCYNNQYVIPAPQPEDPFYGQDAQYIGNNPNYMDNGDGTVTDMVTGLMWSESPDMNGDGIIDASDKLTYSAALAGASSFNLAGDTDWRLPTIKESYVGVLKFERKSG